MNESSYIWILRELTVLSRLRINKAGQINSCVQTFSLNIDPCHNCHVDFSLLFVATAVTFALGASHNKCS